jgi:hypothetical protein
VNTPAQINPGQLYQGEEWRAIPGFDYEASNLGRVRRSKATRNYPAGKIIAVSFWKNSKYAIAHLWRCCVIHPGRPA